MRSSKTILATLGLSAICSTGLLAADPQVKLNENLKPMEKFLGKWEGEMTNEKGEKQTFRTTFEVAAAGNAIVGHSQGQTTAWFWYYDPETKRIITMAIDRSGRIDKGQSLPEGLNNTEFDSIDTYINAEGKRGVAIEHVKWTDNDTFAMWITNDFLEGKRQPDSPKVIAKRVKE